VHNFLTPVQHEEGNNVKDFAGFSEQLVLPGLWQKKKGQ
jgi:hypothetical protein